MGGAIYPLGVAGEYVSHSFGNPAGRRLVMVGVPMEDECSGGVSGERLQVPDGLAALGEQGQAAVPEVVLYFE